MCTTRSRCGIVQDIIYSHFKNSNCDVIMQVHSFMLKMLFHILQKESQLQFYPKENNNMQI